MFRIATWNVNSIRVRLPQVIQWLKQENPDVLAMQETKVIDQNFPVDEFTALGYHVVFSGQKTFNGVAIASRWQPEKIIISIPGLDDDQKRVLCADINGIKVLNIYVPNGSEVGSEKFAYKLYWFSHLQTFVKNLAAKSGRVIILGDFNIAPEDRDVHDPVAWEGNVLVSEPERMEFKKLLAAGFSDIFRLFEQPENSFSWWDYRAASFRRNHGLRIDHILTSKKLADKCIACRIDTKPRKLERPSDHAPVSADFDI